MKITKKAVVPGALIMLLSTAVILLVFLNVSVMGTSSTNSYVAQSQFDSFAVKLKDSYYLMQYVDRYILPKGYMIAQFYFPSSQCYQDTNQLCEVGAKYDEKNKICYKEPVLIENTCEDSYTFNINRNRCEKEPAPTTAWFYDYCKSGAVCENSACLCLITTSGTPEKLSSNSDKFPDLIRNLRKSNTYLVIEEKTAYYPASERDSLNLMSLTSSFTKSFFDTYYVLPKIISCQRISSTEEPLTLMKIDEDGTKKMPFLIEQCTKLSSITMGPAEAPNQYINWKTEQNCTD